MLIPSFAQASRTAALAIGSVGSLLLATPAMADDAPKPEMAAATVAVKPVRYCFDTETTGTRLTRRVCQTRAAWLQVGVEPNDYVRRAAASMTGGRDPMPNVAQ